MLKIQAHVGLLRYALSEYPILTYLTLFSSFFLLYFAIFVLYWAYRSYSFIESVKSNTSNSLSKKSITNGELKSNKKSILDLDEVTMNSMLKKLQQMDESTVKDANKVSFFIFNNLIFFVL